MIRKRIIAYIILFLLVGGFFYYHLYLKSPFFLKEKIINPETPPLSVLSETKEKEISTPPPLKAEKEAIIKSFLTRKGVIEITNSERLKNGKKALKENKKLNAAAEKKAQDILEKQYFDHISPEGKGPDYFVSLVGYEYLAIGENLALGNFTDDRDLVSAWMASPGHRENILNSKFQEIGVAVIRGNYEGKSMWVAVQEFGVPLTICPMADTSLKEIIDSNKRKINKLADELKSKLTDIKNTSPRDPTYSQMVEEYTLLVEDYDDLVSKTKNLIEKYNAQVNRYNDCVKSF